MRRVARNCERVLSAVRWVTAVDAVVAVSGECMR